MTRLTAAAALHALPGDCAAQERVADVASCDAAALLRALRSADAVLPAALTWLRARAHAGALAALPAALSARDGAAETAHDAAPAQDAQPRGRLRLASLPPPAPAAVLHALRLEARSLDALRFCSVADCADGRPDATVTRRRACSLEQRCCTSRLRRWQSRVPRWTRERAQQHVS
jgi:hypothetical protein